MENVIVRKQSEFSRSLYNQARKGAYYTDIQHCQQISNLLNFKKDGKEQEICCLEPSVGDGSAIAAFVGEHRKNVKIFAVELDEEVAKANSHNPNMDYFLQGDFLTGIETTQASYSLVFSNPPYGMDNEERLEVTFLRKISNLIKRNGVLVYIIPYYVLKDLAPILSSNYLINAVYRFHESEFKKWQQVVVIARRISASKLDDIKKKQYKRLEELSQNSGLIKEIPEEISEGKKIQVFSSSEKDIKSFCSKIYNPAESLDILKKSSPLKKIMENYLKKQELLADIGEPITEISKDHLSLLVVSGYSDGLAGSEQTKDIHLHRGKVISTETITVEEQPSGTVIEKIRTSSKVISVILETDGTITRLEA